MNEIALPGQLRLSFLRWALATVPAILGIGSFVSAASDSGTSNPWYNALDLPALVPPGWVFGVAWTTIYILIGLALAMILNARGARGRGVAIAVFLVQIIANFAWGPLFFAAHQVTAALALILFILAAATLATVLFGRIRPAAAWLMLPYLVWLGFASALTYEIDRRNPDAETLAPPAARANIQLRQGE